MTYGEKWYKWKCYINGPNTTFEDINAKRGRESKRMGRAEAIEYYNPKCREVFVKLGFKYKERDNFEERMMLTIVTTRKASNRMIKRESRNIRRLLECGT